MCDGRVLASGVRASILMRYARARDGRGAAEVASCRPSRKRVRAPVGGERFCLRGRSAPRRRLRGEAERRSARVARARGQAGG